MTRFFCLVLMIGVLASCRSTRKIQTAITKKDTAVTVTLPQDQPRKNDTLDLIRTALQRLGTNHINYRTFSAKTDVDYRGGDGKNYNLNVNIRMYRDSVLWVSATATLLNIEVMRALITRDSVKLINKADKIYTARSVDYLQDVTALPLSLSTLQDLIAGNPVFLDSNIVSYSATADNVSLLSLGEYFKHLVTLSAADKTLLHSKLDDADIARNRTADLTYGDYENKKGQPFSTKRRIIVAEKTRLDIKLDFKQYDFNGDVSFPFSVPKNYDRK